MSTQMKSIQGLIELPTADICSHYASIELHITRFYGGIHRGVSVQLSLHDEYIQLGHDGIKELIDSLQSIWEYGNE